MRATHELHRKLVLILIAAGCIATTGYRPVGFKIRGDLQSGVVFGIPDLKDGVGVVEFAVGEVAGGEFWRLEGRAEVKQLVYGEAPPGLWLKTGPLPLKPNRAYYVVVFGHAGWWGRDQRGGCSFFLDSDGKVLTEQGC